MAQFFSDLQATPSRLCRENADVSPLGLQAYALDPTAVGNFTHDGVPHPKEHGKAIASTAASGTLAISRANLLARICSMLQPVGASDHLVFCVLMLKVCRKLVIVLTSARSGHLFCDDVAVRLAPLVFTELCRTASIVFH